MAGLGAVALAALRAAYAKLGVKVNTRTLPLRRGVPMADAGEIDGDLMHSAAPLLEWPRLIRVQVPVTKGRRVACMRGTGGITDCAVLGQVETDALMAKHGLDRERCKRAEPVLAADRFHSLNRRHAVEA